MHARSGKITSISDAGDGKHSRISIAHGKKKKNKVTGEVESWNRHTSDVHVPNAHAKQYAIGQRVNAGISPFEGAMEDDEEMVPPPAKKKAPGKKIGAKSAPPSKAKNRFMHAMLKGRK